jgi:aldose sugar dehydrogenase
MKVILGVGILVGLIGMGLWFRNPLENWAFRTINRSDAGPVGDDPVGSAPRPTAEQRVEVIAQDLEIPWEIVFLPDGDMLVTERPGRLLRIGNVRRVVQEIEGVEHVGEGGLMGMALHPEFTTNGWVYLYLTSTGPRGLVNRVERYRFDGNRLDDKQIILEGIEGGRVHDGGRIAFGPDGYLYVATGDAGVERLSQDRNSLNGKILRIRDDGSSPDDNPFGNAVYSYGHRNVQGLAWDDQGRLWATEHGPSGVQTGDDELNLIEAGQNYGWPAIRGDQEREGMVRPVIHSGRQDTWAPAGMAFWQGSIFFGGLRGETLYEVTLKNEGVNEPAEHLKGEFGRIRVVVKGPDERLYVATSNRDGRGSVNAGDDKILRIVPEAL